MSLNKSNGIPFLVLIDGKKVLVKEKNEGICVDPQGRELVRRPGYMASGSDLDLSYYEYIGSEDTEFVMNTALLNESKESNKIPFLLHIDGKEVLVKEKYKDEKDIWVDAQGRVWANRIGYMASASDVDLSYCEYIGIGEVPSEDTEFIRGILGVSLCIFISMLIPKVLWV